MLFGLSLVALTAPLALSQTEDGSRPIRRTTAEIMRQAAAREALGLPRELQDREIRKHTVLDRRDLPQNPDSPRVARLGGGPLLRPAPVGPLAPQTIATPNFTSVTTDDAPALPPDTMGAIGPSHFLTHVNGRVRVHLKSNGAIGALDAEDSIFWLPVREDLGPDAFVSDPRVRFDRLTDRWFLTILDIPGNAGANGTRILIAVSDGPQITSATVWSFYFFDQDLAAPAGDAGCVADYPSLGIDANALYIGANIFCGPNISSVTFSNSAAWVVRKSVILGGAAPANLVLTPGAVTAFRNLLSPPTFEGVVTPQGVDNYDPFATKGYLIGVDGASFGRLVVREVNAPGSGAPTLSANQFITVPSTADPMDVPSPGGTLLDGGDDRLLGAHLRGGRIWTNHQIQVDATGVASTSGNRNGTRWYAIDVNTFTPVQVGTVFDPAASNPLSYWMGSIMVSGQGHAAGGFSAANAFTRVSAATVGRLSSDAGGTTRGTPVIYKAGTADYSGNGRWGDYSMTSLDPCDDMTMWTIQEYAAVPSLFILNWGAQVVRLLAPPPPVPASASPAVVATGQASVNVTITGNTASGAGWYDTPSAGMSPSCRQRIAALVGNGVVVNSVTVTSPGTIVLNLNTTAASVGTANVTLTNPDGQSAAAAVLRLLPPVPVVSGTKAVSGTMAEGGTITYSVTLSNTGAVAQADNAGDEFTDVLPGSLTLVSAGATSGTAVVTGNTVTWNGSIASGASVTIIVQATVNGGTAGQLISNQGTIAYDADNNGTNETTVSTDDPSVPGAANPTVFQVASNAVNFFTITPCRVIDTRNPAGPLGGPALVAGTDRTFTVAATCGIPATAKAISVNLAVTQPTVAGNLRLRPGGITIPQVATIVYAAGQTRSNNAVVPLNPSGQIGVYCAQASGTVAFILDVNGYFE